MRWFVTLTLALVGLLGMLGQAAVSAQEAASYQLTTSQAYVRSCPKLECSVLYTYSTGTLVFVTGMESGDTVSGSDQWLVIRDPLFGKQGYIHTSLAQDTTPPDWQTKPIIPTVSETAKAIYQHGLELGNNPRAFSKVGDCQNVTSFFLAVFDKPDEYTLGSFSDLQKTIDQFSGSFSRESASVDNGYNVASVLSPLWANPKVCSADETPDDCEYRLNTPSFVIISMETWWSGRPASDYEAYLRQIVEFWIGKGVVPILATKADNLEGDGSINASIAKVAQDYDVPLWNFWLAAQTLPAHGLTDDNFHLTFARNFFDDPARLEMGWPVRNLTALEALDAVWRGVTS